MNNTNRVSGHFCAHTGQIGRVEPPEDGDMSEMTLPSGHRIRNSNPGGLKPSVVKCHTNVLCLLGWGTEIFLKRVDQCETRVLCCIERIWPIFTLSGGSDDISLKNPSRISGVQTRNTWLTDEACSRGFYQCVTPPPLEELITGNCIRQPGCF